MSSLEFVLDMSGNPREGPYIGSLGFDMRTMSYIIESAYTKFFYLNYRKGKQLRKNDFMDIIRFLLDKNIHIGNYHYNKNHWKIQYSRYREVPEFQERMAALLFFQSFRPFIKKDNRYSIKSCIEEQNGKIERIFHHINRLGSINRIDFDFSFGWESSSREIRLADIIAYSGRVIRKRDLEILNGYMKMDHSIPENIYRFIFSR